MQRRAKGHEEGWLLSYADLITNLLLFFVVLLTAAIVVSLKIVGALLIEALVVIPAAAARPLARSLRGQVGWSVAIALLATLGGLFVSVRFPVPIGGAIVLVLALLFGVAFAVGRRPRGGAGESSR